MSGTSLLRIAAAALCLAFAGPFVGPGEARAEDMPEAFVTAGREAAADLAALTKDACACDGAAACLEGLEPRATVVGVHAVFLESVEGDPAFGAEVSATIETLEGCAPDLVAHLARTADATENALTHLDDERPQGSVASYEAACKSLVAAGERVGTDEIGDLDGCIDDLKALEAECAGSTDAVLQCLTDEVREVETEQALAEAVVGCISVCM